MLSVESPGRRLEQAVRARDERLALAWVESHPPATCPGCGRPLETALPGTGGRGRTGSGAPTRVDSGPTGDERRRPHPRPGGGISQPHHRYTSSITASWLSSTRRLRSRRCSTSSAERYATASWTAPSSSRCRRRSSPSTTSDQTTIGRREEHPRLLSVLRHWWLLLQVTGGKAVSRRADERPACQDVRSKTR